MDEKKNHLLDMKETKLLNELWKVLYFIPKKFSQIFFFSIQLSIYCSFNF